MSENGHLFENSEYKRSLEKLQTNEKISYDTFETDKKDILNTIDILAKIMKSNNYQAWLDYLTPESKAYWSQKSNLKQISTRLPVKSITLKSLEDYFKYVFKPSRQGKQIDEIRYLSSTYVKAVQVNDNSDVIYYTFVKQNGKWLIELDRLE